jgi:phosphatidylserine/phosphatidylglycerophosphate/cardiolipin synthase-like enzyme
VLASMMVDKLRKRELAAVICHFFFRDDNRLQADGATALQALLHQILSARATIPRTLAVEYDNKGEAALAHFQSLWKILLSVVAEGTDNIICILDGLDECESRT